MKNIVSIFFLKKIDDFFSSIFLPPCGGGAGHAASRETRSSQAIPIASIKDVARTRGRDSDRREIAGRRND